MYEQLNTLVNFIYKKIHRRPYRKLKDQSGDNKTIFTKFAYSYGHISNINRFVWVRGITNHFLKKYFVLLQYFYWFRVVHKRYRKWENLSSTVIGRNRTSQAGCKWLVKILAVKSIVFCQCYIRIDSKWSKQFLHTKE